MLVLSRKLNEVIVINDNIRILVADIRGNQVRLGIEAADSVKILREELCAGAEADGSAKRTGRTLAGVARGAVTV